MRAFEFDDDMSKMARSLFRMVEPSTIVSDSNTPFSYEIRIPQKGETRERPVLYISWNTKDFEKHYESMERELACVVWDFIKMRHLLEEADTTLFMDHAPIREVLHSSAATQYSLRIDKFRMLLALFLDRITVHYRPGKDMTNVDPLSRATWSTEPGGDTRLLLHPPHM